MTVRSHYGERVVQCMGCRQPIQVLLLGKHRKSGVYHNPGCLRLAVTAAAAARMIDEVLAADAAEGQGTGDKGQEGGRDGEGAGDVGALPAV